MKVRCRVLGFDSKMLLVDWTGQARSLVHDGGEAKGTSWGERERGSWRMIDLQRKFVAGWALACHKGQPGRASAAA